MNVDALSIGGRAFVYLGSEPRRKPIVSEKGKIRSRHHTRDTAHPGGEATAP